MKQEKNKSYCMIHVEDNAQNKKLDAEGSPGFKGSSRACGSIPACNNFCPWLENLGVAHF